MFPYPSRRGPARRPPAGLHRHRRLRALPPHDRQERPALPGLRRLRPARRAVRRADRPAPAQDDRGEHDHHEAPAAPAGAGPRRPAHVRDDRPRLLPWTQWIFLQIFNSWYDADAVRATAAGAGPARSPSSSRSSSRGERPDARTGAAWAELTADRARASPRRLPAGLHLRGAGQLVPGPGHRAGQRGGHQRRPLRARQLPRLQAQPAPVDDAHHRVRRPAGRRPRRAWTGPRPGQAACSATGSAAPGRPRRLPRRWAAGRVDRGLHHPPRHAVRRDLHGAGARAPAGRRARPAGRLARGHAGRLDGRRRATPAEAVAAYRLAASRKSDVERQTEGKDKTGVFTGAFATNPGQRASRSRSSSPTTS